MGVEALVLRPSEASAECVPAGGRLLRKSCILRSAADDCLFRMLLSSWTDCRAESCNLSLLGDVS